MYTRTCWASLASSAAVSLCAKGRTAPRARRVPTAEVKWIPSSTKRRSPLRTKAGTTDEMVAMPNE